MLAGGCADLLCVSFALYNAFTLFYSQCAIIYLTAESRVMFVVKLATQLHNRMPIKTFHATKLITCSTKVQSDLHGWDRIRIELISTYLIVDSPLVQ